jgi:hypothetical protein
MNALKQLVVNLESRLCVVDSILLKECISLTKTVLRNKQGTSSVKLNDEE